MSIRIMSAVWDSGRYEGGTLLVLLALADWAQDDGTRVYPGLAKLAEKARLTIRGAQLALEKLKKDGVIVAVENERGGRGKVTHYHLVMERVNKVHAFASEPERVNSDAAKGEDADTKGEDRSVKGEICNAHIDNHQEPPEEPPSTTNARASASLLGEEGSPQTKPKKPSPYPSTFERWWSECRKWPGFSPNMSKPDALKEWNQAESVRPATGDMAQAAIEYRRWLEAENETRAKRRDKPHPTLHPSTWLRQRRWTGFLEAVALRVVADDQPRCITLAPEHVEALRSVGLTEAITAAWFSDGEYLPPEGGGPTFIAPTQLKRDWIERNYIRELKRAFGVSEITITVKQETKAA